MVFGPLWNYSGCYRVVVVAGLDLNLELDETDVFSRWMDGWMDFAAAAAQIHVDNCNTV